MSNDRLALVSVIVPAFNEAGILQSNLRELLAYLAELSGTYRFETLVINDGSTDRTALVAEAFAASRPSVRIFHHVVNRGLGAALRTGFSHAGGQFIVALDLDMSYAPDHLGPLLHALTEQRAAMAIASPYLKGGCVNNVPWLRKQLSAWANHFLSLATGGKIATLTGMVRAYDASALGQLKVNADGMNINHELVFAALKQGMHIAEIPARLEWRTRPVSAERSLSTQLASSNRRFSMRILCHLWSVVTSAFRHRPAMIFAIPGMIPGLLPFVSMVALLARPSHTVVVSAVLATMALQTLSLAYFALLTGSYVRRLRSLSVLTSLPHTRTHSHA